MHQTDGPTVCDSRSSNESVKSINQSNSHTHSDHTSQQSAKPVQMYTKTQRRWPGSTHSTSLAENRSSLSAAETPPNLIAWRQSARLWQRPAVSLPDHRPPLWALVQWNALPALPLHSSSRSWRWRLGRCCGSTWVSTTQRSRFAAASGAGTASGPSAGLSKLMPVKAGSTALSSHCHTHRPCMLPLSTC